MNLNVFLLALSMVESGGNDLAVGKHGERGRYQITGQVWRQHTITTFDLAKNSDASTLIASLHIRWLIAHGVAEQPFDLAFAWHRGLTGYQRYHKTTPTRFTPRQIADAGYADRVANLCQALQSNHP